MTWAVTIARDGIVLDQSLWIKVKGMVDTGGFGDAEPLKRQHTAKSRRRLNARQASGDRRSCTK
jgi:hypothetical protein